MFGFRRKQVKKKIHSNISYVLLPKHIVAMDNMKNFIIKNMNTNNNEYWNGAYDTITKIYKLIKIGDGNAS